MSNQEETPTTDANATSQAEREANWAKPVAGLNVSDLPASAINLNVAGRKVTGPLKGFGQLWQKTYRIRLTGSQITPKSLIEEWKAHFPEFWPGDNRFYGSLAGIKPGDVAVLNLAGPGGSTISTGILVIYADDESFSFMTPQGHIFAGMNTFSSFVDDGVTVAQIQLLVRASDPIYEMGCRMGLAHRQEDQFWHGTLANLAERAGSDNRTAQQVTDCVDPRMQWSEAANLWHNAAIRTAFHMPVRAARRIFGRG